jgi:lipopolysaccharide export system permease protein
MGGDIYAGGLRVCDVPDRKIKMKIIQRLYLKDFLALFFLLSGGLSVIFGLLDMIDKIGSFLPGKASAADLFIYVCYNIPRFFLYVLPMSVLICGLFTFSQAVRKKEITSIKTAGGKIKTLFYPFVFLGAFLSLFSFVTGEAVVPDFSKRAVDLRNFLEGKSRRLNVTGSGLWLRGSDGSPIKIDLYIAERNVAKGINIFVIDGDSLKERIHAEKAHWSGNAWVFENVTRYLIKTGRTEQLKTMTYKGLEPPGFFNQELKSAGEMGIAELYQYNERLKSAGFRNIKLSVDLYSKISFPLVSLFMMLLGISLSLRISLGGGLFSAGLGLFISLIYWLGYTFALSMGYAGVIPALLAAWAMPALFGALSTYFFIQIPE